MALCIPPGFVAANGDAALCAFLEHLNANGIFLVTCDGIQFVPAICEDAGQQGAISFGGSHFVKLGSVASKASLFVQRDANKVAFAKRWEVETGECLKNGTRIEQWNVHVGSPFLADDPGQGEIAAATRLRCGGDINIYGGNALFTQRGIGKTLRYGTQFGYMAHQNLGLPHPLAGGTMSSHLWIGTHVGTATDYTLMVLNTDTIGGVAEGILYNPGGWTFISDVRLKNDPAPKSGNECLDAIKKIEPISFNMKGKAYTGFSAQNIQTAIPSCVGKHNPTLIPQDVKGQKAKRPANLPLDEVLTVRHGDILAHTVGAVKELATKLETALAEIENLRAEVAALKGTA